MNKAKHLTIALDSTPQDSIVTPCTFSPPGDLITVSEAAKILRLGRSTVYLLCSRQESPHVRFGKAVRIPYKVLETWIRKRTELPGGFDPDAA